jgi:probable HAF family extracellular repeat protein
MQNTSQLPSAPAHAANSGNAPPAKRPDAATVTGYTITDLGALAGNTSSVLGYANTFSAPLNNAGQAAGASGTTATLFSNGTVTNINTLNSTSSLGVAINASGQVVGQERNSACSCWHAFLYSNGSMQDINDNSLFPVGSSATGINKTGQVVGSGTINNSSGSAFLYSNGKMTEIRPFSGSSCSGRSINDAGQIIGSCSGNTTAATYLLSNGVATILSQTSNVGFFINNNGQIVGQNTSNNHGVLYSNGTWTDLGGGPPGASGSAAFGINSSGQIVGFAGFPAKSYHPFIPAVQHAIIFTSSGAVDLNSLIPSNSGYTLNFAVAINDAGQIAVNATNSAKQHRALLLTPK